MLFIYFVYYKFVGIDCKLNVDDLISFIYSLFKIICVYLIGWFDKDFCGLLILINDGEFCN